MMYMLNYDRAVVAFLLLNKKDYEQGQGLDLDIDLGSC